MINNSKGNNTYYFVALLEGDLLTCSAMSQIIKIINKKNKTILLLPEHPRVSINKQNYYPFFDLVYNLPYCTSKKNIFAGFAKCYNFLFKFNKILIPDYSILFMFNNYDIPEILIYQKFRKQIQKKKIKLVSISLFESGDNSLDKIEIVLKNTISLSIYSLFFTQKLFYEYRTKNTSAAGIRYYDSKWDYQLGIQNSFNERLKTKKNILNLPYPPKFLNLEENGKTLLDKDCIVDEEFFLILVASSVTKSAITANLYWNRVNLLINYLEQNYNYKIYIKDHPGFQSNIQNFISNKSVVIMDKEIHAERLFLINKKVIKAVFGYGSSSLLTASWLGINSFNLSAFFGFTGSLLYRLNKFISLSPQIQNIIDLHDLEKIRLGDDNFSYYVNSSSDFDKLLNAFVEISKF